MNRFDVKYKFKKVSETLIHIGNKLKPSLAKVYDEPYSTHIPVIIGVSNLIETKSVLELGSGIYSTGTFLNEQVFPDVEKLVSYEDDEIWAKEIMDTFSKDRRLQLNFVKYPIYKILENVDIEPFDLILVDDSRTVSERTRTITELCSKKQSDSILLIHDFEIEEYRKAAKSFKHYFTFSLFTPCTGVLWNKNLKNKDLFRIFKLIEKNKNDLKTTDIEGWLRVFNER